MSWLAPMTALYAGAASVSLLVLLYFLKLKRRSVSISSTLLWKRAVRDLQVNAPFQKLRRNILLLLQLLTLLAALVALGRPVLSLTSGPPRRYVLLIDRSASMNATDLAPSRLEVAKSQAKEFVGSLRTRGMFSLRDQSDQAMVVAFDEHAKVMGNFTSDKRRLEGAIDSIEPTDAVSSLAEAVTVARAFAQPPGEEANNRSSEAPAVLELFSDGRIRDAEEITAAPGELNFHCVGKSGKNLAVVAMQARRSYEKADEVEVFATLANYGPEAAATDVQLSLDGNVRSVRSVRVPPRTLKERSAIQPGGLSISFSLSCPRAGVIEVRQLLGDGLSSDDAAWAILPPPRSLTALLVTRGNAALRSALKACPLANLEVCTPAQFDAMDHSALSASPRYDVIVLDNHAPSRLPRGRFLVFGVPPPSSGASAQEELKNQLVVDWRSRHPVLQFVNLTNLFAARCHKLSVPSDAVVLAEFSASPALALVRRQGSVFLLAPFDCMETNWPFEPGFVMFCYNAALFLGMEAGQEQQSSLRVNQAISIEHLAGGAAARVRAPDGGEVSLFANAAGAIRYPGTSRAGVYDVAVSGRASAHYAVNLLDAAESNIAPAGELSLMGQAVAAQQAVTRGNVELWPVLVMLALALACLEWLVYNLKVRL